jgi:hypothetical protein
VFFSYGKIWIEIKECNLKMKRKLPCKSPQHPNPSKQKLPFFILASNVSMNLFENVFLDDISSFTVIIILGISL